MGHNILEINNLTKYYGKTKGVENLSIQLKPGEVFGFIGPNGAGKSTTIRSIMNLINKTEGSILIDGKEFHKNDVSTKKKIGYLPREVFLYEDMTVKSMLDYHEEFYKKDDADKSESVNGRTDIHTRRCELVEMLQLDESKKIEDLSLGNLKKVGIILALMHQPKLLILDEPTSGLDPIMQNKFYDLLLEEKKKGTTIFYSTHILSEVSKICDRVGIIRNGNLIKIEDVDSMSSKRLTFVTIISDDVSEIKQNMDIKITEEEGNKIRFANNMEDDKLIKQLSKYKIDKILIEEATLEDMFMHYYTEEK